MGMMQALPRRLMLEDDELKRVEQLGVQMGINIDKCPACGAGYCPENAKCQHRGGAAFCKDCGGCGECDRQMSLQKNYLLAGIGRRWFRTDWDMIEFDRKGQVDQSVDELARNLDLGRGLTFLGPVGTGKTTAATYVIKQAIQARLNGRKAKMVKFDGLINAYRDPELLDAMKAPRLLLVDEVYPPSSDAQRELYDRMLTEVLGDRYDRLASTIITSNMDTRQLAESYPRLESRQQETNEPIPILGEDQRRSGGAITRTSGPLT